MEKFGESIDCCNMILKDYPKNGDVLFDKACNLVMLSKIDEALDNLQNCFNQGNQYKIKAKNSKFFGKLSENQRFQKMLL